LVVVAEEERTGRFDLRRGMLRPLTDVGRVFALEKANASSLSTVARLLAAGDRIADQKELFAAAAVTCRVALYHQARIGLRDGTAGWSVEPEALSKQEQQTLKGGFRTIMKLLELTAHRHGIRAR